MSEQLRHHPESSGEKDPNKQEISKTKERHEQLAREAEIAEKERNSIEQIQEKLEKALEKQEKIRLENNEKNRSEKPTNETAMPVGSQLRNQAVSSTLKRTRKQLKPLERGFSKFVHQNSVESVSDATGATIARPSGLLAGGFFGLVASLAVLYICSHYGYEYNYLIGLVAFAGGFVFGILIEIPLKILRAIRK